MAEDTYMGDDEDLVSPLQMLSGAGFSTVTPEGKAQASKVFGELYGKRTAYDEEEKAAYDDYEASAQTAREVLRKAREVLAAKKTPSTKWLELARGFGAPTKSGSFGESISNYAGERIPGRQRESEWEQNRDQQVLGLDQGMGAIDQGLALQRFKLKQLAKAADDKLIAESMKIMGKPTPAGRAPPRTGVDRAQAELDKAYVKDYVPFIQGGAADATKNIEELRGAHKALTSSDMISGPVIGLVPKIVRDLLLPKSSETQEAIESTVQRSLKDILGSQFTQKEGENLLARVYNPRLEDTVNARRVAKLVEQLERAYQEKIKAANYFEQHGTLSGYTGKKSWTMAEFLPPTDDKPFKRALDIAGTVTGLGSEQPAAPAPQPGGAQTFPAGPDEEITIEMLLPAKARGGAVRRFAEGGSVDPRAPETLPDGRLRYTMPDGRKISARPGDTYDFVLEMYTNATGTAPSRPGLPTQQIPALPGADEPSPIAAQAPAQAPVPVESPPGGEALSAEILPAAGAVAGGAAAASIGNRIIPPTLDRLIPGRRESQAQRRVLDAMQERQVTPQSLANQVRSSQRMGVPSMAMDEGDPALRTLANSALTESGGTHASDTLRRLKERADTLGDRTMEQVNMGLKPDEYFDQLDKLKDSLYTNAKPLYEAAYQAHPSVQSTVLPELLNTPDGKKAVKAALRLMRNQGKKIGKADALGMIRSPSLEFLDQVKRGFDQLISKEEGSGVNHQATPLGKSMRELRDRLRNELDTATANSKGKSLYKEARTQYAGDLEVLDALQTGRENFGALQPNELKRIVGNMSFAEKDAFRTGVAQKLFESIETPAADINAARKVIGSPAMRRKLEMLFDTPKQYQLFETALTKEMDMHEDSKKSIAAAEAGQNQHFGRKPGMLQRLASKVPRLGFKSPTMWTLQFIRNASAKDEDKIDEVLKYMKASSPDELRDLENTLGPKLSRRVSRAGRKGKVAAVGAGLGAAYKGLDLAFGDEEQDDAE